MKIFDGYDPASPTLCSSPLVGTCMRGIIPDEYRTCYVDRAAPIASGDFVRLWIAYPAGDVRSIIKTLRVSRDGRWWGECADGIFQLGTLVRPFNVEKVVAFSTDVLVPDARASSRTATPEEAAHYAMLAQEVVCEWQEHGHVDGVPFPGLARLNYYLPDNTSTRNPEYRAPEPL